MEMVVGSSLDSIFKVKKNLNKHWLHMLFQASMEVLSIASKSVKQWTKKAFMIPILPLVWEIAL